jgi:hypothetical protein
MKTHHFFIFFSGLLSIGVKAQTSGKNPAKQPSAAKHNTLSIGLSFPIGVFKRTHTGGVSVDYFRSKHRYGDDIPVAKLINFALNGGVSYHVGKSITTAGYESRYDGYLTFYGMAGIDYKPAMPVNISLTAGPVLSIYKGSTDAGAGVNLFWSYFFSKNIALGPGISYRKFSKTDALWSGTVRALYAF